MQKCSIKGNNENVSQMLKTQVHGTPVAHIRNSAKRNLFSIGVVDMSPTRKRKRDEIGIFY